MLRIISHSEISPYYPRGSIDEKNLNWEAARAFCEGLDPLKTLDKGLDFLGRSMPAEVLVCGFLPKNSKTTLNFVAGKIFENTIREIEISIPDARRVEIFGRTGSYVEISHEDTDLAMIRVLKTFLPGQKFSSITYRTLLEGEDCIATLSVISSGHNRYSISDAGFLFAIGAPVNIFFKNLLEYQRTVQQNRMLAQSNIILRRMSRAGYIRLEDLPGLKDVVRQIKHVAPLEFPVLILGETGVGKEVVADALQENSIRAQAPYVKVNCGGIPEQLVDSELFGHEKGAFTGAVNSRMGRFERANKGTLLLDEIGELPLQIQARLLRVLQSGELDRVGGSRTTTVDVRVLAATNVNLQEKVVDGLFREDLFFRLNIFPIIIPPLRNRPEDIIALARHFAASFAEKARLPQPELTQRHLEQLCAYPWPGNVRQLKNTLEHSMVLWGAFPAAPFFLRMPESAPLPAPAALPPAPSHFQTLDEVVAQHIRMALEQTHGRVNGPNGAAALLGVNPSTLRARMDKLGIVYGIKGRY